MKTKNGVFSRKLGIRGALEVNVISMYIGKRVLAKTTSVFENNALRAVHSYTTSNSAGKKLESRYAVRSMTKIGIFNTLLSTKLKHLIQI